MACEPSLYVSCIKSGYKDHADSSTRPTLLNATAGLLTSVVNIYTAKEGDWSIMALLATIVTGLSAAGFLALVIIYRFGRLVKVKQEHELEMSAGFHQVTA